MKTLEDRHPIVELCQVFGVARSGYYRWREAGPTARASEDARLIVELKAVHAQSRQTYGRPRLLAALRQRGERTSAKRVARLMRQCGLRGVRRPSRSIPGQRWRNAARGLCAYDVAVASDLSTKQCQQQPKGTTCHTTKATTSGPSE